MDSLRSYSAGQCNVKRRIRVMLERVRACGPIACTPPVRLRVRESTAQQQPFSFFFFEAFNAFLDPDLSFLSFFSFFPEALALPGAAAACPPAFPGEPRETPATPPGTETACGEPGTAGAGAGWPLSCAISSGVTVRLSPESR